MKVKTDTAPDDDPLWYKDAIIYQMHVKTFFDSDDDGMGDFNGLTQKLEYLQNLGITAIWLLPFYPSPLKDDGYDISDCASSPSWSLTTRPTSIRGFSRPDGQNPAAASAIFMSGAIRPKNSKKHGSSFRILNRPTGAGIRWPVRISGIGFTPISRI